MNPGYRILYHHRIRSDDGQAVHVRELIRALRELGHEVLECALVPKANGAATMREAGAGARESGLRGRLSLPRRAVELLEIGYGHTAVRRLLALAREFRPDFVYERHALHCVAGLRASRKLRIPLLLEVNAPLTAEVELAGKLRYPGLARRTERKVLGRADRVLAVTSALRDMLLPLGARPERTLVIANAADPARFGPEILGIGRARRAELGLGGDGRFVLGFIGFMRHWHRLDLAVELLTRPQLADVSLLLVGDGPAMPATLQHARTLGVQDRVVTVGALPQDRVPEIVGAFDAALIPAANDYASPLKIFDSLAAGVPTIAPRQPNIAETIEHGVNGLLFEPGDIDSLALQLATLVGDRDGARRLGAAGRQSLIERQWTWLGNARRVVESFEAARAERAAR
ncbi:MAG: glycosyltransferase family 4 protein [Planctomycetes bacterium]|nr:glycosyltransferase family 4 protein [Planctomycetota bacterium]